MLWIAARGLDDPSSAAERTKYWTIMSGESVIAFRPESHVLRENGGF